jgi:DNA polymerase-3 subunit alpha
MACNAVCRRVLSAYGFEQHYINKICKSIPDLLGISLKQAYDSSEEFKGYMNKHNEQYEVMQTLEGLMSHISQHAAGIVICNKPICDVVPCMTVGDDREMLITQWHKKILEKLGFFKFDFLALKTLTLIDDTIKRIKENYGVDIDLEKIDLKDRMIYQVLNSGDLSGVFQMSEPAGQQIIERIKPNSFNDIVAANALCRPGVKERDLYVNNKSSGVRVSSSNAEVQDVLHETYGAIVYQEQTMLLMNRLTDGKWSLGKADSMRKVKDLEEFRADFLGCCASNGVDSSVAGTVFSRFDLGYSFNKSHAVCYSVTTAQTAWLKGYYRKEFMAALMTIDVANPDVMPTYIKECKRYGINTLIPEINSSLEWFVTTGNDILMPLNAIKGVGDAALSVILKSRSECTFDSFEDFIKRTKHRAVNKKVILSLIKAGCFDKHNPNRSILIAQYLASRNELVNVMTWCDEICIHYELETLGIALTRHPLDGMNLPQFANQSDGVCSTGGIVTKVNKITDKNGKVMAFVTIENKTDVIEVICFAYVYNKFKTVIQESNIIRVSGRKEGQKIIADTLEVL